ncbi:MAG: hypothetical protein IPO07_06760 [Haliscomenobacter sp.]|nr:hypothetical protein [Haliscomenobacter sp.]MBK9488506.1 hypothetical protein [Haliscomenobacter sp.]
MKNQYRWFVLFTVALAFIFSNAFTLFQDNSTSVNMRLLYLLAIAAAIALHFTFLYGVAVVMQRVAPGLALTKQRISATLLISVPFVSVLMVLTDAGQALLQGQKLTAFEPLAIAATFFQAAAIGMFVVGLSEAVYQYEQLQKTEKEKKSSYGSIFWRSTTASNNRSTLIFCSIA